MSNLLVHEDVIYEHETIYLSGNAYFDCTFSFCTFIVREAQIVLTGCTFNSCIWHLDMLVSDHNEWKNFINTFGPFIDQSLPRAPDEKRRGKKDD